jgi:hypothetical protein
MAKVLSSINNPSWGRLIGPTGKPVVRDFGLYPWWAFCVSTTALLKGLSSKNMENQNSNGSVPKKKVSRKMLIILGVCILIWLPLLFSNNGNSSNSLPKEKDYSITAYVQSKGYVKTFLKSPATANFPYMDYQAKNLGDNRFIVSSYVDSQNAFGALLRSNWVVTIQYLGGDDYESDNWKLETMTINGEKVYP